MVGSKRLEAYLNKLDADQLELMEEAGIEVLECQRVLSKADSNVVAELIRNEGTFYQWEHYPKGDVVDWETHSQYYYHAHPKEERSGEHGHFHTFVRYEGIPSGIEAVELEIAQAKNEDRVGTHVIGLSMDPNGFPIKLFTTNRWVTDETWYAASDMVDILDQYEIDHTHPSWAANRWLTAMIILFRPQIIDLINKRDKVIKKWMDKSDGEDVFENRDLEVISEMKITVNRQIQGLKRVLDRRRGA